MGIEEGSIPFYQTCEPGSVIIYVYIVIIPKILYVF